MDKDAKLEVIVSTICSVFNITKEQLLSKSRKKDLIEARMVLYGIAYPDWTYVAIGNYVQRDHSTVLYGANNCNKFLDQNGEKKFQSKFWLVDALLYEEFTDTQDNDDNQQAPVENTTPYEGF
jgi:chromosomal replication initiation ATPase DnaA